jgi:Secretion system C-terminal sorting domain
MSNPEINECSTSIASPPFSYDGGILLSANAFNGTRSIISGNHLTLPYKKRGISLIGLSGSQIMGNAIALDNSSGPQKGLMFEGVSDLQCIQNNVDGATGTIPSGRVGLLAVNNTTQNNPYIEYICNELVNTDNGALFRTHGSNVNIDRIKVDNANDGWFVDNSTLGFQTDKFNRWCGTFNNAAYSSTAGSFLNLLTPSTGPGSGCQYDPFNINVVGSGIIQAFNSINSIDPGCSNYLLSDTITLTFYDQFIIDSMEYYSFSESIQWHLRRSLMQKLGRNPQLLENNQSVSDFWNQYKDDEIGHLATFKNRFDSLMYTSNDDIVSAIKHGQDLLNIKSNIIWLDSILQTRPEQVDSILYLNERDSLNQEYNFISYEADSLWKSGWQQVNEPVNELHAELYELTITTDWGEKERQYYSLATKLGPWNVEQYFSSADSSLLIELAHLCEREYGNPVTWARGVYANWFEEEVDEEAACGSGLRKTSEQIHKPANIMMIKPNPAANQINVKLHPYDTKSTYFLRVYTINGNFVNTTSLTSADSYLDISYLQNGVYIAELMKDHITIQRVKLTIVR